MSILAIVFGISTAILGYMLYSIRRVRVTCEIHDPSTFTMQNIGEANVLLYEKVLHVRNIGRRDTYVYIDIRTSCKMALPPKVDTSVLHIDKQINSYDGYYGKYINVYIPILPPDAAVLIRTYCRADQLDASGMEFFEDYSVIALDGRQKIKDCTSVNFYKDRKRVIPH